MKEIRICDMDSDRVVLEAIMEGVNGLIRAKNEESAPSASTNTGSPKLSGAVCRWCYGHKDMCEKCVFGSEFSPAAQHRAGA